MAEQTGISWTDSTFNPWIGCTKVSPGCDHCYAEALDKRHRWKDATHWGAGVPRMRTSPSNWAKPLAWNKKAFGSARRHLVFCASLADVFDNEVPDAWRGELWRLIDDTPALTWLLLTKRIGNVAKMWPGHWPSQNVWLGASIVNQEEADRDIPKLLAAPAAVRFVSYEPALGPVDFSAFFPPFDFDRMQGNGDGFAYPFRGLDWIIVGGESSQGGARARPFDLAWARSTVEQCKAAGVACFVKQLGSSPGVRGNAYGPIVVGLGEMALFKDRAGADPEEWPEDLRVQEFPS